MSCTRVPFVRHPVRRALCGGALVGALLTGCADAGVAPLDGALAIEGPAPVADAGFDQLRVLDASGRATIELDGRASCDPTDPLAHLHASWRVVAAPGESPQVTTLDEQGLRAVFVATEPGDYIVALEVQSRTRDAAQDHVLVRVVDDAAVDEVVVTPPDIDACGGALR